MRELVDFIPKTATECRSLLSELRKKPENAVVTDRYGKYRYRLSGEENKALRDLVSAQIGEKETEPAPVEKTAAAPTKEQNNATEKNKRQPAKKTTEKK